MRTDAYAVPSGIPRMDAGGDVLFNRGPQKPSGSDVEIAVRRFCSLSEDAVWGVCVRRDPRLEDLRRAAGWFSRKRGFCAVATWESLVKPRLEQLVGWYRIPCAAETPDDLRGEAFLHSELAYEVCHGRVAEWIPECTHDAECGLRNPRKIGSTSGHVRTGRAV